MSICNLFSENRYPFNETVEPQSPHFTILTDGSLKTTLTSRAVLFICSLLENIRISASYTKKKHVPETFLT